MPPILQREGLSTMGQRGRIPAGLWRRILLLKGGVDLSGLTAYEDFEGYQLGEITKPFNSIPGWLGSSGPKSNFLSRVATEDFESYDAEDPLIDGIIDGGTGWDGPLFVPSGTTLVEPTILPAVDEVAEFPLEVTLIHKTDGVTMYYTTDGTTPSRNTTEFTGPFNISDSSVTVKAMAVKDGNFDSEVATRTWSVIGSLDTPKFRPPSGNAVTFPVQVAIYSPQSGVDIHFTTDGSTPDENSTLYTEPISVADDMTTVKAIAVKSGFTDSSVASGTWSSGGTLTGFSFESGTFDVVSRWNKFFAGGGSDHKWNLTLQFDSETTVNKIEVYQVDSNTLWNTHQVWATDNPIYPKEHFDEIPFVPDAPFNVYCLGVVDGGNLVKSVFANPLKTFGSGSHALELYGQIEVALSAPTLFIVIVTLAGGDQLTALTTST